MADYQIVRFFKHPKADRKVMHVRVTDGENPEAVREFYWELSGYRTRPDDDLVREVKGLLGLGEDYPLECPPYQEAA